MKTIPTIFAKNKKEFNDRFQKLLPISNNLHIDFMDGKFVRENSISIKEIPNLRKYKNNFEAHLMTENPEKSIKKLKRKGFKKIIFHYESLTNYEEAEKIIKKAKRQKLIPVIAINPETKVAHILPFINQIEGVLFMGVRPGREHQSFIPKVYKKIKQLKKLNKKVKIQVDGGINFQVAKKLSKLGVDAVNSGSLIAEAKNPKEVYNKLSSATYQKE